MEVEREYKMRVGVMIGDKRKVGIGLWGRNRKKVGERIGWGGVVIIEIYLILINDIIRR